jgi:hypothetical protein
MSPFGSQDCHAAEPNEVLASHPENQSEANGDEDRSAPRL